MNPPSDSHRVMHSAGYCAVCAGAGNAIFLMSSRDGKIFYGCPECGCAWAEPPTPSVVDSIDPPRVFAPDGFYVASLKDLADAGLAHRVVESEHVDRPRLFEDMEGFRGWR